MRIDRGMNPFARNDRAFNRGRSITFDFLGENVLHAFGNCLRLGALEPFARLGRVIRPIQNENIGSPLDRRLSAFRAGMGQRATCSLFRSRAELPIWPCLCLFLGDGGLGFLTGSWQLKTLIGVVTLQPYFRGAAVRATDIDGHNVTETRTVLTTSHTTLAQRLCAGIRWVTNRAVLVHQGASQYRSPSLP
jgi:hypothetical protein